jgi:RNA polymerase sigma-70 factor (ECF subfamily)
VTEIAATPPLAGESRVERAAAGDEVAFARLIAAHNRAMARVAYVIVGDREHALDAVQSAWTIAWRKIGSLRDQSQVGSWLISIAANEARQIRRRDRRAVVVDISDAIDRQAASTSVDSAAVLDLERALSGVSADDRRLLALRFVAGFDSFEIARLIGGSPSGVRSRLARLIQKLRAELQVDEGIPT